MKKEYAVAAGTNSDGGTMPLRFSRTSFNRAFLKPPPESHSTPSLLLLPAHLDFSLDKWREKHPGVLLGADFDAGSVCAMDDSQSGFAGSIKCGQIDKIRMFFDPTNTLEQFWNKDEIRLMHANCTIDSAEIVFVCDDCHYDEAHAILQGQLGNAVRKLKNVILLEGVDASGESEHRISTFLNPEFKPDWKTDDVRGWDDNYFYSKSRVIMQQTTLSAKSLELAKAYVIANGKVPETVDAGVLAEFLKAVDDLELRKEALDYVMQDGCKARNDSLLSSIRKQLHNCPEYRIIVFGGSAHTRDSDLLRTLCHSTKLVAITARLSEGAGNLRVSGMLRTLEKENGFYK